MSRGNIVMGNEFVMRGKSGFIESTATPDMAPKSRLIIFAVREENNEILVDSIDFRVTGIFQNDIKLSINKDKTEPNEKVKIRVKARSNSFVGIVAVDQSTLLLKDKNNDVTIEMVRT